MMTLKVKPLNSQPDHCAEPSARESVWVCLGRLRQGQSPRNGLLIDRIYVCNPFPVISCVLTCTIAGDHIRHDKI